MLILTRRIDEKILIGDDIVLCVLDIEGSRVKLGLEAPRDVTILREEIQSRYSSSDAANDPRRDDDQQSNTG
ncbi:MAG: carbon storage regulator CsrA [Methylococcales bacterium]|nr:carbon storage regulator CsrA [Methylococcales bacterium]